MQRVTRWMASKLTPPRRRRSDAGRVAAVVGAGMVGLGVAASMVVGPLRSQLQAAPARLGRVSALFGRLVRTPKRAVDDRNSVVLTDADSGDGVQPKAPAARSTVGEETPNRF